MGRRKWLNLFVVGVVGFFVISIFPEVAAAKVYKWKLFLYFPPQVAEDFEGWCKDIKNKTNGNLDIRVFYDGEHPFKAPDLTPAVKDRSCELGNASSSYIGGLEPIIHAFELPMMAEDSRSHLYVIEHVKQKWYEPLLEQKWNQKLILWTCYPGQAFHTKDRFVDSFDSLKGIKFRIYNIDTANMMARAFKATPITMPIAEVYIAAQRGVVDGATLSTVTAYDSKWFEIFRYTTIMEQVMSIDGINVNLDAWKELPAEYQKVVLETAKEWQYKFWLRREMDFLKKNLLAQKNYGVRITYANPKFRREFVEACQKKVWPDWIQRTKQPQKAQEFINDCTKYREEFAKMPKDKQKEWLIKNGFPKEVLD